MTSDYAKRMKWTASGTNRTKTPSGDTVFVAGPRYDGTPVALHEDDAALIIAAPEMQAVLQEVLQHMTGSFNPPYVPHDSLGYRVKKALCASYGKNPPPKRFQK